MSPRARQDDQQQEGRRELAALAIARGRTLEEASAEAHVTKRTVQRWRSDPAFIVMVDAVRADLYREAAGALAAVARGMAGVLASIAADTNVPPAVRVRAAAAALDQSVRLDEHGRILTELHKLRQLIDQHLGGTP